VGEVFFPFFPVPLSLCHASLRVVSLPRWCWAQVSHMSLCIHVCLSHASLRTYVSHVSVYTFVSVYMLLSASLSRCRSWICLSLMSLCILVSLHPCLSHVSVHPTCLSHVHVYILLPHLCEDVKLSYISVCIHLNIHLNIQSFASSK